MRGGGRHRADATATASAYLTLAVAALLVGCSLSPSADFVRELGKDPATGSISILYPYGTILWCRTGITNGTVTCGPSGIKVESMPTQVNVPISVVPSISVGTPSVTPPPPPTPRSVPKPLGSLGAVLQAIAAMHETAGGEAVSPLLDALAFR